MIKLTRLNHVPLIVNSDLIAHVDTTPDTVVTLTSGQKFMVLESAQEIVEKVIDFRRAIAGAAPLYADDAPPEGRASKSPQRVPHGR